MNALATKRGSGGRNFGRLWCAWLLLCPAVLACGHVAAQAQRVRDAGDSGDAGNAGDAGVQPPVAAAPEVLRVGYAGSAPFVLEADLPEGLSVDVWRVVAERAGLDYELEPMESVPSALAAVRAGRLDLAVGPISITSERAQHVRFTQPYFNSQIGILAAPGSAGALGRMVPFFTRVFAGTSLVLLLSLLLVGLAIWLLERRRNASQFPPDALRGIGNGVWFALVTMTTVGYGDRVPLSASGRALAGVWMLVALVTTSSLTAGLASAFTVLQLETASIRDASELRQRPVAVVRGTTAADFAASHGAVLVARDDFEAALDAVERGDAVALVHDRPMLQYYLAQRPETSLKLVLAAYAPQSYGFAVAGELDILRELNIALLACQESGQVPRIVRAWLGVMPK